MVLKSKNIDYLKTKKDIDRFLEYDLSIFPKSEKQIEQLKEDIRIWEEEIIDFLKNEFYLHFDKFIDVFGYVDINDWKEYTLQKILFVEKESTLYLLFGIYQVNPYLCVNMLTPLPNRTARLG